MKREHHRDLILQKWKVDLTVALPEGVSELTAIDEETRSQQANELVELREQIESMGEVNLAAEEEFQYLSDRNTFLAAQKEDLVKSLDSLDKTIRKIDATTRKLFMEAYEGINYQFQKMFPRLFNGGKAELMMLGDDTQDPLERGMTIMARPPGKKLQNINLLSGGEKSMTAASLIFAIFKYKPVPFSILDEVDAALDEENTRRLNTIAHEISNESQLVVITHNKTSMEIANNLYGITMGEPGLSKLVSVRLKHVVDGASTSDVATPAAETVTADAVA